MNKPSVRTSQGAITLGKLVGKGGEGTVYEVVGRPDRVAKIYHQPIAGEKVAKIEAMVAMRNDRLLSLAAWPLDVLRYSQGQPCGLVMPMVDGHKDIHTLYSPRSRKVEFPNADWRFLVRAAANTARAFAAIHGAGCIIGDVNHGGVRVSDKATVRLIDCDSFQVIAGRNKFLCEVGVPTFTPPELQGRSLRGIVRSPNHDNFGLAVLIFHLLFIGRHPFAGRFLGRGDMSIETAIAETRFAYGSDRAMLQMEPPPGMPPITIASQPVVLLLERAFSPAGVRDGVRPSAQEWITALDALEKNIRQCQVNSSHYYFRQSEQCPWCRVEAASGAVLFTAIPLSAPPAGGFDVGAIWALIKTVQPPGPAPALAAPNVLAPSAQAVAIGRAATRKKRIGILAIALVAAVLCFAAPQSLIMWLPGGLFACLLAAAQTVSGSDISRYNEAVRAAEEHWRRVKGQWDQETSDLPFLEQMHLLERLHMDVRDLDGVRQRRYQELVSSRERAQRQRFLERFEIERAKIPGIGPGRKAMLQSYNIETAWDVHRYRVMGVPGFGPALARELDKWRKELESKFRFDPTKGVDQHQIAALDREITRKKQQYIHDLSNGFDKLNWLRDRVVNQRATLKPVVERAAHALAQARADLDAIS